MGSKANYFELLPEKFKDDDTVDLCIGSSESIVQFWPMMGPILCGHGIAKDLRGKIHDGPQTIWFLLHFISHPLRCTAGAVIAFCALDIRRFGAYFRSNYTLPKHRGLGVGTALNNIRDTYARKHKFNTCEVRVLEEHLKQYTHVGFRKVRKVGKYFVLQRQIPY